MDETDMRPGRRFTVVVPQEMGGHVSEDEASEHISAVCAHSTAGVALPPMVLLSNKAKLPKDLGAQKSRLLAYVGSAPLKMDGAQNLRSMPGVFALCIGFRITGLTVFQII